MFSRFFHRAREVATFASFRCIASVHAADQRYCGECASAALRQPDRTKRYRRCDG